MIKTSLSRMQKITPFILGILYFLSSGQAQAAPADKPNIVWIVCEDISPFIGAYGDTVVLTPNIDQLAKEGIRFTHVYTTAGVCAPSRSAIITGMYQTSIGTQHMRTTGDPKYLPVPSYSAVIPPYVKCFPEYLRKAGYYCTNNEKQDYQFAAPVTVWDENSPAASWRNRPKGSSFFSVFNLAVTHESQLFPKEHDSLLVDPARVAVPPFYPDTKTVRHDIARLMSNIQIMDGQVGKIIQMLKEDGLYDNTIIFFYSDHGGALPWMKREVLERGIHIPFIVHMPGGEEAGTVNDEMISSVDFAPSVLSLAGIPIPAYLQGQAFLGAQKAVTPRRYIFAARDRMDTEYDRVRSVRDQRFMYVYNYMPEKPNYQNIAYRLNIPMMKELLTLRDAGQLPAPAMRWFDTKPVEELYDVESDPHALHNLTGNPEYEDKLEELRAAFQVWTQVVGDMGSIPEEDMISRWWHGQEEAPVTAKPVVVETSKGIKLYCDTDGASIGYRIIKAGVREKTIQHTISSWDFRTLLNPEFENGQKFTADPVWQVYNKEPIRLNTGDTLKVDAMRIGYQAAEIDYVKQ